MKKLLLAMLAIIVLCAGVGVTGVAAFAAVDEVECDKVFIETVQNLTTEETNGFATANKEILYDISLEELGYLYLFEINGNSGYAIVINAEGNYECTEIYFDAQNPYDGFDGDKIYVWEFVYWTYADGIYTDVKSGAEIDEDILDAVADQAYFGAGGLEYSGETVYFQTRSESGKEFALKVPQYAPNNSLDCVPVASANIIVYNTRFKPNLMPGYTPGTAVGSKYLYKADTPEIRAMVETLKTLMGTDSEGGTTIPQFKNGMASYCNDKGYFVAYNSCMSGGSFSYDVAKQRLEEGQALILFTRVFEACTITKNDGNDYISTFYAESAHAMASFGYKEVTYVFSDGTSRTDKYIQVSTGVFAASFGYCKSNGRTAFDDAYAVNIY